MICWTMRFRNHTNRSLELPTADAAVTGVAIEATNLINLLAMARDEEHTRRRISSQISHKVSYPQSLGFRVQGSPHLAGVGTGEPQACLKLLAGRVKGLALSHFRYCLGRRVIARTEMGRI